MIPRDNLFWNLIPTTKFSDDFFTLYFSKVAVFSHTLLVDVRACQLTEMIAAATLSWLHLSISQCIT